MQVSTRKYPNGSIGMQLSIQKYRYESIGRKYGYKSIGTKVSIYQCINKKSKHKET